WLGSLIGQLQQDVGVAEIVRTAGAYQVLAAQLGRVQALLDQVIPIRNIGSRLPSELLVGSRNVRLGEQSDDVSLLERILPFRAVPDKRGIGRELPARGACTGEAHRSAGEKVERHCENTTPDPQLCCRHAYSD